MGLKPVDWEPYLPINPQKLVDSKIEVHYLGYYEKWHPQNAYYYSIEHGGFQSSPERTVGTYSTYNSIDDRIDDFHYHTTFIKFGIGRATYDASQEIRSGDITRDEGIALIKKYDGEFPHRWAEQIFQYLSIDPDQFPVASTKFESPTFNLDYYNLLCDKFRSPHLWRYCPNEGWKLRHRIWDETDINQENTASNWVGNLRN